MTTGQGATGPDRASASRALRFLAAALTAVSLAADVGAVILFVALAAAGGQPPIDVYTIGGIVVGGAYAGVGWLIASRRPGNAIGWIFLAIALSQTIDVFAAAYAAYSLAVAGGGLPFTDPLAWVAGWAWAPGFTLLVTLSVLLFPEGRPPSRRWRPVVWASYAALVLLMVPVAIVTWGAPAAALQGRWDSLGGDAVDIALRLQAIGIVAILFAAAASIAGMVWRFRHAGPTERQQLKWFTFAAIPEIAFVVSSAFVMLTPLVAAVASILIAPLLPVAAAIAILRYHLYEIDRIVSRTIAYAALTGVLVIAYATIILLVQQPLGRVTGGDTIAVAISTLAVAGLFQPVRVRVQRVVDRRFDRASFDAERTTAAFSDRLRHEVDLSAVTADLDATIRGVLAPARLAIWLRGRGR